MDDSRSFRDAFIRRKAPARDGLGGAPDKFRKQAAASSGDAFKTGSDAAPQTGGGDAFAPKAKPVKMLPGVGSSGASKARFTQPATPAAVNPGQPKPAKPAPVKQPKMALGKSATVQPAFAKPQKMTAPASPSAALNPAREKEAKLTKAASQTGSPSGSKPGPKDPFGRKDAKLQRQKALVPAASAGPSSPMTRPLAKPGMSPVPGTGKIQPPKAQPPTAPLDETFGHVQSTEIGSPASLDETSVDAARAPLQIVANESVLEHTGFKKFRRAARSSSLVLVSGAAADAIASTHTLDAIAPDADEVSTTIMAAEDSDTRVTDKPVEPSASPANPSPAAEKGATSTGADGPPPSAAAKAPEPAGPTTPPEPAGPAQEAVTASATSSETAPPEVAAEPVAPPTTLDSAPLAVAADAPEPAAPIAPPEPVDPTPEVIAATTAAAAAAALASAATAAEKPIEVVEATVEPASSVPYDTASEPVDQLASGPKPRRSGTASAVETSWQEVAGDKADQVQPTAAVLRKMETSPVAGYWDGATAGAKSALSKRGFNQDDIFGVVFGVAVLAFLLLWFVRGRGEETPAGDLLATPQSMTGQSLAALPPPAPAPKVDPFGNAPVNLKPTGPIPEASSADPQVAAVAPPAATPSPAPVAPATASPPAVAASPAAAIPIAERKMHAWFCTASSRMTRLSRTALTGQMAKFEDVFAGKELIVRGYADTRGSTELNADLGSRRAQTVADYLTAKGLSVVDVQGVGELNGLDDNQNCPNQRRVDIWVKGGPAETPSRACAPETEAEALICG